MNILATDRARYIGSHILKQLLKSDDSRIITILDNL
jgi:UDP-glucose 4-epimerase